MADTSRVPAGWDRARKQDPDHDVLSRAGFESAGHHEFSVEHHWTIRERAGYIRSTSFLPPPVLAKHAAEFDADLTAELGSCGAAREAGVTTGPDSRHSGGDPAEAVGRPGR